MIVPDTNVLSEVVRSSPNPAVTAWMDQQRADQLYLATPVIAEMWLGVHILPGGRRKTELAETIAAMFERRFRDRVIGFDRAAAEAYARIVAAARSSGQMISAMDGQIAAIADVHHAAVATRDTAPFLAAGVLTINPWQTTA